MSMLRSVLVHVLAHAFSELSEKVRLPSLGHVAAGDFADAVASPRSKGLSLRCEIRSFAFALPCKHSPDSAVLAQLCQGREGLTWRVGQHAKFEVLDRSGW